MKKKLYCILAFVLVVSLLASCGAGGAMDNDSGAYYGDYYYDGESYLDIIEGGIKYPNENPETTFSLKVDTASYTNVKRYIEAGNLPPEDAVRTEELINYFNYDEQVVIHDDVPFGIYTEIGPSPFDPDKLMAFIRVKTLEIDKSEMPNSNLVFLIDSSGSMDSYDKLPLLKEAFMLLVEELGAGDRVSIVTYAGSSRVVLSGAGGNDKAEIIQAINSLDAGGSTAGADGIYTAYELAKEYYISGGNNRVILATDGDFNVGISDVDRLSDFIFEKRGTGVYLSVLGFGTGNIRDDIMETLAKDGNGNYSYIDSVETAKKVLVDEMGANLFVVAEDVKAQLAFNADTVASYRLIGYENRMMDNDDFSDDSKDAGEIGAGTDIVVMVEFELKSDRGDFFEVRLRYKDPGKDESRELTLPVGGEKLLSKNTSDFGFACAVAMYGHLLRGSEYLGDVTYNDIMEMAESNYGRDNGSYRRDFVNMLDDGRRLFY
jgi:Uncharacterized protein containing a von Willebrand factor type A (vWA) domain